MIDARTIEMINADLDGELSAAEKMQLEAEFSSSSEARDYRDEMQALVKTLKETRNPNTPKDLKSAILENLRAASQQPTNVVRGNFGRSWMKPMLSLAASFAVAVLFIQVAINSDFDDMSSMSGSMVRSDSVLEAWKLDKPGLSAKAKFSQDQATTILQLEVVSASDTSTIVSLPDQSFELVLLTPEEIPPNRVMLNENGLIIRSKGKFKLSAEVKKRDSNNAVLSDKDEVLDIKLIQAEKTAGAGKLRIPSS